MANQLFARHACLQRLCACRGLLPSRWLSTASESERLVQALDGLAEEVSPSLSATARYRGRGRRRRTPSSIAPVPISSSEVVPWEAECAALVQRPEGAESLLAKQQELWHTRLAEDRLMQWHSRQQLFNATIQKALQPKTEVPSPVDELQPDVVQGIFDAVAADPGAELAERRDMRRAESLALQIEHLMACPPPRLRQALRGQAVRIATVEAPRDSATDDTHTVHFETSMGQSPTRLQKLLSRASPVLAACLARRLLVGIVPKLRFVPAESTLAVARCKSPLWRVAKKQRRVTAHRAMQSWVTSMNW
eukprot:TRINITY_DN113108_c0_g1_i1.p1 TRINITY_DN113108_c0_g1~~TRINITY_DN113108_c0_g1_i1.p1  ORF type:complete len:315 (-),score=49.74 TRINITY_DN113108_c0_g1_i1:62-982(-)